jgi:rare lipoprotein A (peptidoglycan hydrolase)
VKRPWLVASFWAALLVFFAIIDAGALPDGTMDGISTPVAPSYGGASQYEAANTPVAPSNGEASQYGVAGGQIMMASYYGYTHAGDMTASGEIFDPEGYTAAHRAMPFGTRLLVSNGGNSVVVTVDDRGPYVDGIDLDLSQAAADTIGLTQLGVAPVEVTVL